MKRLLVGSVVAFWIALAFQGSVAAQSGPESVPNSSAGITQASARTTGSETSGKYTLGDIIVSKKDAPGGAQP